MQRDNSELGENPAGRARQEDPRQQHRNQFANCCRLCRRTYIQNADVRRSQGGDHQRSERAEQHQKHDGAHRGRWQTCRKSLLSRPATLHLPAMPSLLRANSITNQKMNLACFEKCITTPSSSLSKTENACIPQCTEKYIAAWNLVHSTLISRLQREAANAGASGL